MNITETQKEISKVCQEIQDLLIQKNKLYGNSATEPLRVFSNSDPLEQIRVRIDDKLSRIKNRKDNDDEDVVKDLIGYLILYKVAENLQNRISEKE